MSAAKNKQPVVELDAVAQQLQALQAKHGVEAVEAARARLGIARNELQPRDLKEFANKYEEKFADPNPYHNRPSHGFCESRNI